jgi:hypothetical protein
LFLLYYPPPDVPEAGFFLSSAIGCGSAAVLLVTGQVNVI